MTTKTEQSIEKAANHVLTAARCGNGSLADAVQTHYRNLDAATAARLEARALDLRAAMRNSR